MATQRGLKLKELMKLGNCIVCGKKQLESGLPLFYCITVSRAGFNGPALQRAAGLEMMVGSLASVFSPDEDLAQVIDGPHSVFVHETCADKISHLVQLIPEIKEVENSDAA
jgi:hypothetical protein